MTLRREQYNDGSFPWELQQPRVALSVSSVASGGSACTVVLRIVRKEMKKRGGGEELVHDHEMRNKT